MDELLVIASVMKPNVIGICESWLSENVSDSEIRLPGYSSYRCDRCNGKKGGGVCVYVGLTQCCEEFLPKIPMCPLIECVTLILKQLNIILIVAYIPPGLSSANYQEISTYLINIVDDAATSLPELKTIIAGDLNQFPTKEIEHHLCVQQIVDVPTRGEAVLDKFLVDQRILSTQEECSNQEQSRKNQFFSVCPELGNSDHRIVFLKPINVPINRPQLRKVIDFRSSHMIRFKTSLANYPWHKFYRAELSADDKCDLLHSIIEDALSAFPVSYVKLSAKDKPWMTLTIKSLINRRYEAFRCKQYELYRHYKLKIKEMIHKAKQSWTNECCKSQTGIWSMVKNASNKEKGNSLLSLLQSFDSLPTAANAINKKLSESFTSQPDWQELLNQLPQNDQKWEPIVTCKGVQDILSHLSTKKAAGSDDLTARVLKEAAQELSGPLAHVLALSFETAIVPRRWKVAKVIPVPKKNNPKIDELRPLSMLPQFSKIMEKLALKSIKAQLVSLYGSSQFGFRPGYSTTHAHIRIHDFITQSLNFRETKAVVMISFDMKKAFDSLNHKNLIQSLSKGDFSAHFLKWCANFLQDRSQFVCVNQLTLSSSQKVTSGIPQGSVIAPFLFAAHMGSLKPYNDATCMTKYADDVVCLVPILNSDELENCVNNEVANVDSWCQSNGLQLNTSKTKVLIITNVKKSFSLANHKLTQCTQLKILGLTYSVNLKWDTHIYNTVKKASRQLYILRKLRPYVPSTVLVKIYNAIILSTLEYCAPVMVGMNKKNAEKLEKVRRRCHRVICGSECECAMLEKLSKRRLQQATKLFQTMIAPDNLLNDLIPHQLPHSRHYIIHPIRTSSRLHSFIPHMTMQINKLKTL